MDAITITILDDGTIKTETGKVSAANHGNAEGFIREMFKLAGGEASLQFKRGSMQVTEKAHDHEHSHQ